MDELSEGLSAASRRKRRIVLTALTLVTLGFNGVLIYLLAGAGEDAPVDPKVLSTEARVNVLRLCSDVQSFRDEHGVFLAAGPVPVGAPRGGRAVAFVPDENFRRLGFSPGERVHLQYQVVVQETPLGEAEVTCFARADRDGDGQVAVYSVTLDANGMTSAVKVEREEE